MIRFIAIFFGVGLIFSGAAGFMNNGALLGIFTKSNLLNVLHMATGIIAIMAATKLRTTKLFFLIFGIFYTLLAVVGFVHSGDLLLMQVTLTESFLHLIIGLMFLFLLYYFFKKSENLT